MSTCTYITNFHVALSRMFKLVAKFITLRATFKQLHIVVVDHERRDYLTKKHEDLYDFHISIQNGLCYDIDPYAERIKCEHNVRIYKHYIGDNYK